MSKTPNSESMNKKAEKAIGKTIRGELHRRNHPAEASIFARGKVLHAKYIGNTNKFGDPTFEIEMELPNKETRVFLTDTIEYVDED